MSTVDSLIEMIRNRPGAKTSPALLLALHDLWVVGRTYTDQALEPHAEHPEHSVIFYLHRALRDLPWLMEPLIEFMGRVSLGSTDVGDAARWFDAHLEADRHQGESVLDLARKAMPLTVCLWVAGVAAIRPDWSEMIAWGLLLIPALLGTRLFLIRLRVIADRRIGLLKALRAGCLAHLGGDTPELASAAARSALPMDFGMNAKEMGDLLATDSFFVRYPGRQPAVLWNPATSLTGEDADSLISAWLDGAVVGTWLEEKLEGLLRDLSAEDHAGITAEFTRLGELEDDRLRRIMRRVDKVCLSRAFLGAPMAVVLRFFDNMGPGAQPGLVRDMERLGRLPAAEILAAQRLVVDMASR